jgi:hypothetical protein
MKNTIGGLLVALLLVVPAQGQVDRVQVSKAVPFFTWPQAGQAVSVAEVASREQVGELLNAISDELWGTPVQIGRFAFARCWPGRATLVASYAVNGWSTSVAVVDWDGFRTLVHQLPAQGTYDLDKGLTDVDGDALAEIVTQTWALGYEGANTRPVVWKRILKMRADYTLEDVSIKNRAYFEARIIPQLDELDARLPSMYEGKDLKDALSQVQFVRDKYRRMLYGEAEAGLANARRWAQDSQWELQALAILAFEDIGTKEAREAITKLSISGSPVVAVRARDALRRMDLPKR